MNYIPYYTLFSLTLFTGTLISLSSTHWIYVWMGFEINLMSFLPIILHSNSNQETEAAVNYFLTQALGSSIILLAALSILFNSFSAFSSNLIILIIAFALIVNIGAAPFHFWLPQVIISISWTSCIILTTWQNIAPLFIITSISSTLSNNFMISLGAIGAIIGGLGGLNQTHLRPLLAYSSISHLGWIISATCISIYSTAVYFSIYSLTTLSIISILYFNTINSNYISSLTNSSTALSGSLIILFLSLGGLPPLLGFFPNWVIINSIITQNIIIFTTSIILGSLISLFYYISLFFNIYTNHSIEIYNNNPSFSLIINTTIIATITLGLIPLII